MRRRLPRHWAMGNITLPLRR